MCQSCEFERLENDSQSNFTTANISAHDANTKVNPAVTNLRQQLATSSISGSSPERRGHGGGGGKRILMATMMATITTTTEKTRNHRFTFDDDIIFDDDDTFDNDDTFDESSPFDVSPPFDESPPPSLLSIAPTPGGGAVLAAVLPPAPPPPPPPSTDVVVIGNDGHAPAGTHPNVPNNVRNCIVTCFGSHPAHHLAICDALGCSAIVGMDWLVRHLVPYAVDVLKSKPALIGETWRRDRMVRRSIARSVRKFGLLFILFS